MLDLSEMITLCVFILGAAFGSFSLALSYRLKHKLDWVKGRSVCEHCGHQLKTADLIPILSWVSLRGRCRYCRKPLSTSLILSELGLGVVFAASYAFWPSELVGTLAISQFVIWLLICTLFSALFWYDLTWMILPNKLVYPLIGLAGVHFSLGAAQGSGLELGDIGLLLAAIAIASGLFLLFYVISNGKWIGFGDVRLGVALGLLAARPEIAALNIFLASLIGTMLVLPIVYVLTKKVIKKLPFGPLLIVAAIIIRLFGTRIFDWYLSTLGL